MAPPTLRCRVTCHPTTPCIRNTANEQLQAVYGQDVSGAAATLATLNSSLTLVSAVGAGKSVGSAVEAAAKSAAADAMITALRGNPTFPMFNQLFHSSLTAATGGTDGQFRPRTIMQWLFYPFYWATKQRGVVTETVFADPRYALATLALLALIVARLRKRSAVRHHGNRGLHFLAVFASISFVLWMASFSILRYAIPIEALTGLLMLAAMHAWQPPHGKWPLLLPTASVLLLMGILTTTTYPNWWRGAYGKHVFEVDTGTVEANSLVILVGSPNAYLAPMFPRADTVDFVGLTWFVRASQGYGLWDQIQQRLREHTGPRYVVLRDDPSNDQDIKLLSEMLPLYQATDCHDIASNLEMGRKNKNHAMGLRLCRLTWTQPG